MKDRNYNLDTEYAKNIVHRSYTLTAHPKENIIYFSDKYGIYPNFAMYINSEIQVLIDEERQRLKRSIIIK